MSPENLKNTPHPCPVTFTLAVMGGKWKPTLIYLIAHGTFRFGELGRAVAGISRKVLAVQLKELEADGVVARRVFAQVPPKVEYSITEFGHTLLPIIDLMHSWGKNQATRRGLVPAEADDKQGRQLPFGSP